MSISDFENRTRWMNRALSGAVMLVTLFYALVAAVPPVLLAPPVYAPPVMVAPPVYAPPLLVRPPVYGYPYTHRIRYWTPLRDFFFGTHRVQYIPYTVAP